MRGGTKSDRMSGQSRSGGGVHICSTVVIAEMDLGPLSGPLSLFHKCVHIKGIKYHRWIVLNEIYQPY